MIIPRITLVLLSFWVFTKPENIEKEITSCVPKVDLKCNADGKKRFSYYVYKEVADINVGCDGNKITSAEWALLSKSNSKPAYTQRKFKDTEMVFTIPTRAVHPGKYILQLAVTETGGGKTTETCPFRYISEPPVLIFQHGNMQFVLYGILFTVDITKSKFPEKTRPNVIWKVDCRYVKETEIACRKIIKCKNIAKMTGLRFTGILNICFQDAMFTAKIIHDGKEITAKQVITPRKIFKCKVEVICEKNCDKGGSQLSNPKVPIVLKVQPTNLNCLFFKKSRPYWVVSEDGSKLEDNQMEIVNENKRLIIKKNSLNFDKKVYAVVSLTGQFEGWIIIQTTPKIKNPKCTIQPNVGISLETKFSIRCQPDDPHLNAYGPFYSVYQVVNGEKKLLTSTASDDFKIVLSAIKGQPQQTLVIEGRDLFYNTFDCDIEPVTVNEIKLDKKKIDETMAIMGQLAGEGNQLGPQHAVALINELKQSDLSEKDIKHAEANVMKGLSLFKVNTMDEYEQIASISKAFINQDDMNLPYKQNLGKLCKQLSTIQIKELHKNVYVKYQQMDTEKQAQMNKDCADKLLEPIKEDPLDDIDVTTFADVEPVVKEDYEDYKLPLGSPTEEEIKTAAQDVVLNNANAVASTLNPGQTTFENSTHSKTLIAVEEGTYMAGKNLEIGSIKVVPDTSLENEGANIITAIISNYDKDVLTPQSDLSSNVLEVHFFKNTTKMHGLNYEIEFPVLNSSVPYEKFTVKPPAAGDEWLQIDRIMNVHRLYLMNLETCLMRFRIEENTKLKIAMSINERPREKHFKNKQSSFIVDGRDTFTWAIHNPFSRSDHDRLFYVAVIPHPDMMLDRDSEDVPYEIQFSTVSCVIYIRKHHKWEASSECEPRVTGGDNDTLVHCSCKKTSMHSIFFKPIEHRQDIQTNIDFLVTDFVNYVIIIHVLIVFVFYAIALSMIVRRKVKIFGRDKIYFLSDNLKNDRYCYMLVVRTGSYQDSGTTANIMAQIFGAKGKSKPHVLNYPDPACKLLQQDEVDWLILAHDKHLGELNKIILWTDSIGLYPNWYCEDVTVIDLQTLKSYVFKVQTWLSALPKHKHFVKVLVTKDKDTKKELNIVKNLRFQYKGKHTWNIFVRDDEELTYPERLSVILSMIYTAYTVNIWLVGPPSLSRSDSFGRGHFSFYYEHFGLAFASSLINSGMHLTLVYFLRNSTRATLTGSLVVAIKRYPFKLRKILWYLLGAWIVFCLMYLIVFGFWLTLQSVYLWEFITIVSLLICIFIWENIFINAVVIISSRIGYVEELVYRFNDILIEIERQREVLFRKFGEVLMRPYFKKHYRIMTPNEIHSLRLKIATRMEVAGLFKDMCMFLIFIIILYLIAIINHDNKINESNRMMHRIIEESIYGERKNLLQNIDSVPKIYDYLEHVIIPSIHPQRWYGNWYARDAGLMADFSTRILGVVQLRQQRRKQKCAVPKTLEVLQIPCTNKAPIFDEWEHNVGAHITSTIGRLKIYDGSGYIAYLGRTLKNSKLIIEILRKNKWIDINTSVFFIEFLAYNANMNMFNAVRIYLERSRTGKFIDSCQISTFSLIYTNIYVEILIAVLFFILTIIIIVMLLKRFIQMLTLKGKYFNDFWNILDIILSCLSITLLIMFFVTKKYTYLMLREIVETDHNKFVDYFTLIAMVQTQTFIYAITLSLATLRLWKFLHFGILFRIMERTILKSGPQLAGLFLYQVCFYLMLVIFIYPMYGENMEEFSDYYSTLVTIYLASINFHEHLNNIYTSMMTVYLYIVYSFHLLVSLCFINMYATTLMINLEESRNYYSNNTYVYSIQNYVADVFNFYTEKLHRHLRSTRLKGGGLELESYDIDVDKLVYPKSNEHRYADIVYMNKQKMKLMRNIALMAIRNIRSYGGRNELTEKDFAIMGIITANLLTGYKHKNEAERLAHIFFKMKDPISGVYKFVPDTKMLQMSMVVKKILEGKTEELQIKKNFHDIIVHQSGDGERLKYLRECLDMIQSIIKHIVVIEYRKVEPKKDENQEESII